MIFSLPTDEKKGPVRRVLLVGFMGSGKSTVGPEVARALGWRFVDVDERIEDLEDATISEIFARRGESYFRAVEAGVVSDVLGLDRVVVATGGGWGAQPGRLAALPSGSVSVWLQVSAQEAVQRVEDAPGRRPLLDKEDPLEEARRLLAIRSPEYSEADAEVDTEGRTPEDVATAVLDVLSKNPWNLSVEKA
jgi:shikimate kinase